MVMRESHQTIFAGDSADVEQSPAASDLCGILTREPRMEKVLQLVRIFAELGTPVLIEGETGTGKELVSRALHALSPRHSKPFVAIDCGAIPDSLIESELFGYERGAFTGADRAYPGRVQAADGGTLFLDEVNSISLPIQAKLLRFAEQGAFFRVGHQRPVAVDVRIVAASNVPLATLVATGRMRADFFYRLNVLRIELPPLRERLADLDLLVDRFLRTDPVARARGISTFTDEVLQVLQQWPWAGNVRELHNVLHRSIALSPGPVLSHVEFPPTESSASAPASDEPPAALRQGPSAASSPGSSQFREWVRDCERTYLSNLLRRYATMLEQSAASGLPSRTLYRKLRSLGLRARRAS